MTRSTSRRLVILILVLAVAGLGIYNTVANRRLVTDLSEGRTAALEQLAERQDAYIFLQAEEPEVRARIASNLAAWHDSRAIGLIVDLLPDPDATVRTRLVASLTSAAERYPATLAAAMPKAPPAVAASLIEAATKSNRVAVRVLDDALEASDKDQAAYLLAKRIGMQSTGAMMRVLTNGTEVGIVSAAEVLAGLSLGKDDRAEAAAKLYEKYAASTDQAFRDRLLPSLCKFAPMAALREFRRVATDDTAPSNLRAAAASALVRLNDIPTIETLRNDPDTQVVAALR